MIADFVLRLQAQTVRQGDWAVSASRLPRKLPRPLALRLPADYRASGPWAGCKRELRRVLRAGQERYENRSIIAATTDERALDEQSRSGAQRDLTAGLVQISKASR